MLATPGLTAVSRCDGPGCQHPEHSRGAHLTGIIIDDPDRDPVVKYDGRGEPIRLSQTGLNRADRRKLARQLRRGA